jgi:hypothetical protein
MVVNDRECLTWVALALNNIVKLSLDFLPHLQSSLHNVNDLLGIAL